MRRASGILLAVSALILACRKPAPAPNVMMVPAHSDASPASPGAISPGDVSIAGIGFHVPERWQSQTPESPMRTAQFAIPGAANEKDASFAVYYFGRDQGGSVADNARRWQGQFTGGGGVEVSGLEKKMAGGLPVTVVRAAGTFASGMPMGPSTPEPNFSLWGAIVEGPQGNVFLKATGPKATIAAAQGDFDRLLATIHRTDATF